ncbi:MAG TPA: hypothetical protein VGO89_22530, partial [Streptomyces sp.]|nr:hypothetical protein [Streptomyces sp.]
MPKLMRRLSGVAGLLFALVFAFPVSASAADIGDAPRPAAAQAAQVSGDPTPSDGFKTGDLTDAPAPDANDRDARVPAWSYHITASCSGYEGSIRQGAAFWGSGTETSSSGTPVECTGGYVEGCGGGGNVVGCNWGQGQRIMLSTIVSDFGLLSAHE